MWHHFKKKLEKPLAHCSLQNNKTKQNKSFACNCFFNFNFFLKNVCQPTLYSKGQSWPQRTRSPCYPLLTNMTPYILPARICDSAQLSFSIASGLINMRHLNSEWVRNICLLVTILNCSCLVTFKNKDRNLMEESSKSSSKVSVDNVTHELRVWATVGL